MYWGVGRECRYSGARRGIDGIWRFLGGVGGVGSFRAASGGVELSRVYWGLAGTLGAQGPEGVKGASGALGGC